MRHITLNFKNALATSLMLASLVLAACGKQGGSVANTGNPGAGPTGVNVNAKNCEVGQVYNEQHGCLNRYSCQAGFGWLPAQAMCVPGTMVTEEIKYGVSYGHRFFGSLRISNSSQFNLLMKYANQCDFYWVGINFGTYKCSNWTSKGGFIEIKSFDGLVGQMYVGAGTANPSSFNPNTMYYSPTGVPSSYSPYIGFGQQSKIVDYNASAGMQIIGTDYSGRDVGIRAVVESGRMTANSFQLKLIFQNIEFATATVTRY